MVMVLRMVADQRRGIAPSALYPLVGCTATIPLLWAYNGGRGRPMKWFFYAYYPAHIAVLGLTKGLLFGDWSIASV